MDYCIKLHVFHPAVSSTESIVIPKIFRNFIIRLTSSCSTLRQKTEMRDKHMFPQNNVHWDKHYHEVWILHLNNVVLLSVDKHVYKQRSNMSTTHLHNF